MTTLTVEPRNKKELSMVKKVLEALEVKFKPNEEESPYNPEFVESILKGREDYKNGKCVTIALEDLWK
jgi:non-homologous end joining protein Ku